MVISVTFLGTGGSVPCSYRGLPSVLVRRDAELLLFDCGEGTQGRFLEAHAGINRKMRIFISHLHGDHIFGLPGLLHTLSFMGRSRELEIIGPRGLKDFLTGMSRAVGFHPAYPYRIREVMKGRIINEAEYEVKVGSGRHGVECLAYAFQEKPKPGRFNPAAARKLGIPEGPLWRKLQHGTKVRVNRKLINPSLVVGPSRPGIKITYAVDTRPCADIVRLAGGSTLLVHDSTFGEESAPKARAYGHSTALEAAQVAAKSKSKMLALFHISAMYDDPAKLLAGAKKIFRNTILPKDMGTIQLKP